MNIISSVSQSLAPLKTFINGQGGKDVKNAFTSFTDAAKELGRSTLDLTKNIGSKIREVTVSAFEATTIGSKIRGAISEAKLNINNAILYAKLPEENRIYIEDLKEIKKQVDTALENLAQENQKSEKQQKFLRNFREQLLRLQSLAEVRSGVQLGKIEDELNKLIKTTKTLCDENFQNSFKELANSLIENFPGITHQPDQSTPLPPKDVLEAQRKKLLPLPPKEQEIDRVRKNLKHVEQSPKEPVKNPFEEARKNAKEKNLFDVLTAAGQNKDSQVSKMLERAKNSEESSDPNLEQNWDDDDSQNN